MYVPVKAIKVFIWGRRLGVLTHDYDQYSVFEYDPEFRKTGLELAPFMMPLSKSIYHVEDFGLLRREFAGLPGMIAERFGIGTAKRALGEMVEKLKS